MAMVMRPAMAAIRQYIREHGRAAGMNERNAWLCSATLAVALVCALETVFRAPQEAWSVASIIGTVAFVAALAYAAFRQMHGNIAVIAVWSVLHAVGLDVPSSALLGVLLAVGALACVRAALGSAAAVVSLAAWCAGVLRIFGGGDAGDIGGGAVGVPVDVLGVVTLHGMLPIAVILAGAVVGGVAVRWGHERDRAREMLHLRAQRERAARDIHDYVSNDLAYVMLRIDRNLADDAPMDTTQLRELRELAANALDHTHQVIGMFDAGADSDSSAGCGNAIVDAGMLPRIRDICATQDAKLAALGFVGQSIVSDGAGISGAADDAADVGTHIRMGSCDPVSAGDGLIVGLLEELYANIAKHADPSAGYALTVGIADSAWHIVMADTASPGAGTAAAFADHAATQRQDDGRLSLGTGLARYRMLIERRGGSLTVHCDQPEWTLDACVPLES